MFGWWATRKTAAYLVPITLVNLTTLGLMFWAILITDKEGRRLHAQPRLDPTDPATFVRFMEKNGHTLQSAMAL